MEGSTLIHQLLRKGGTTMKTCHDAARLVVQIMLGLSIIRADFQNLSGSTTVSHGIACHVNGQTMCDSSPRRHGHHQLSPALSKSNGFAASGCCTSDCADNPGGGRACSYMVHSQ